MNNLLCSDQILYNLSGQKINYSLVHGGIWPAACLILESVIYISQITSNALKTWVTIVKNHHCRKPSGNQLH